jgi:hypothetical protein
MIATLTAEVGERLYPISNDMEIDHDFLLCQQFPGQIHISWIVLYQQHLDWLTKHYNPL